MASYQGYPNGKDRFLFWGKQKITLVDVSTEDSVSVTRSGYGFTGTSPYDGFESWYDQVADAFTDWWNNTQGHPGTFSFEIGNSGLEQLATNGLIKPTVKLVLTGGDGTSFEIDTNANPAFHTIILASSSAGEAYLGTQRACFILDKVASDKRKYPTRKVMASPSLSESMSQVGKYLGGSSQYDTSLAAYINFSNTTYMREFKYEYLPYDTYRYIPIPEDVDTDSRYTDLFGMVQFMGSRPVLVVHEEGDNETLDITGSPIEGLTMTSFNVDSASDHSHSSEGDLYTANFEGAIIFTTDYDL